MDRAGSRWGLWAAVRNPDLSSTPWEASDTPRVSLVCLCGCFLSCFFSTGAVRVTILPASFLGPRLFSFSPVGGEVVDLDCSQVTAETLLLGLGLSYQTQAGPSICLSHGLLGLVRSHPQHPLTLHASSQVITPPAATQAPNPET